MQEEKKSIMNWRHQEKRNEKKAMLINGPKEKKESR
jgi:hypothetical protein